MAEALEEEYVRKRKLFLRILPNAFGGLAAGRGHSFRVFQVYRRSRLSRKYVSDICGGSDSIEFQNCGRGSTRSGEISSPAFGEEQS